MSKFQLNPLIILKTESDRILLAFRDNSNSNIYEFSGMILDLIKHTSQNKHFSENDLLTKVPSNAKEDFKRFWEFCVKEQIFIPATLST